jgi:DNA-binding SARP family transcriptional activator
MDFRLLGPLEVLSEHGRPVALGGLKQRSLLAVLLLQSNELVSTDVLIDRLWGGAAPLTAAKSVQVYVSRLRKLLGQDRLATHGRAYVMHVEPSELDLVRFERLADEARRVPPHAAAQKLTEALAQWRGPALADLAYESFAQVEIARLEELRLTVLEESIDADLACGRHAQLVGDLASLVSRHPLRERFRGQLMLALYRSGRQAEALDAYRAARRELQEELGLEPSAELKRLEQAILCQDPELGPPEGQPRAPHHPPAPDRAVLVVPRAPAALDALLGLAEPLAAYEPRRELIVASVVPAAELGAATARLAERRDRLIEAGITVRTAAFSSPSAGEDAARLAGQQSVELLVMDVGASALEGDARVVLEEAPCDVALLVETGGTLRNGPILVPFGAALHDWAALELAAWLAGAVDAPLRLIGAADRGGDRRDASRLLADASLIVQRTAGVVAEPLLARPGRRGVAAQAEGAGLLVVGLSERWRREGLGRTRAGLAEAPPAPTVFVRRGSRPGGLAPAESRTRFGWSLTGASR